ncbi:FKBP-type peptidyl-prolyl cis-trans isomerase [Draconibacterium sp. IB214405]|uniref:FKBP-type peptidyl-prolyl cis-trans isomerase n=1 Tax=Draconibacterium sp. IB214405 TaxID=3097352 RepID=UPI002A10D06C|nr:FKBP-type peptidyl-prolyl cis-trans isomerase [Draconibacterium sp. IB214405]MDX8339804.1 FKBP-type peptidyl-prolyl cis-trans isomerase [Draconibacterium sp. IB214405]
MTNFTLRSILSFVIPLVLFTSCLDVETDDRTYKEEMIELSDLLSGLVAEGYDIDTTALGVYYVVFNEGVGESPVEGDTLSISYNGYFSDGTLFDTSEEWATDGIWEFVYGEQSLITGFQNALSVMRDSSQMQFIVPSTLAYGEYGYGSIGAYQTLIFAIEMHDIKPAN